LALGLLVVHGLAAAALLSVPVSIWLQAGIGWALALSLLQSYRRHVSRSAPGAVVEALWSEQGTWTLRLASGAELQGSLSSDSFVTVPLTVLNFRSARRRNASLVLTADAVDPELLRRLRVRLRLAYAGEGRRGVAGSRPDFP
jgi:hypothetical protein